MNSRKTISAGLGLAVAAATLAGMAAIPSTASAQSYYDACARDRSNRAVTGGAVGAVGGAVIGSQLSARGRHTENSLLGGVAGAIAGAVIGKSTAGCQPGYSSSAYDDRYYDDRRGYDDRRSYDRSAYEERGYYDNAWPGERVYDRRYYAPPPVVYAAPPPVVVVAPPPPPRYYRRGWYGY